VLDEPGTEEMALEEGDTLVLLFVGWSEPVLEPVTVLVWVVVVVVVEVYVIT
jgi:hypothetical protein